MTWSVDGCAGARNGPAAVQRFDPIHHAGHIFGDGQIAPPQLFQSAHPMLSVVDRLDLVGAQQLCQLSCINPIALVPDWVRAELDDWLAAAAIDRGRLFRRVNKAGRTWGDGMTVKAGWHN